MKLPGPKFQPSTQTVWFLTQEGFNTTIPEEFALAKAADNKYFESDRGKESYMLDPIFMGDYKGYKLNILSNDIVNHNFFLFMDQYIIPRKCIQVIDKDTSDYKRNLRVLVDDSIGEQVFEFKVQRIDGCADEYPNTLVDSLTIET